MEISLFFSIVSLGVGATLVMDLWAFFLKRAFAIPSLNYCLVGRWLGHMPEGRFAHQGIGQSEPKVLECHIGWGAHYVIGVVFAAILVAIASPAWLQEPTIIPPIIFGLATVAVPFFVMQPAFGLGMAASKTPNPKQARIRSLMAHASFGVGLYFAALMLSFILPAHA
ncbi:hypothetical protein CAI21_15900 [Alkalilimnicola ehrlichii]|uniref:DUF2938 domain-containing protein n=1 Tax=Alkalilimnicola ehrlichii TaxID=351052 RepID=A0A3E0WMH2_9GAMM|nr:DUF2938 domain-containing protein [Alkalilimnicola ehrlichii]RFA27030.1 hypothetical protein CAI21_15900 [Alkalilimnicola ehrlichii]RFA34152.1 hypothetical protein CAL65_16030 [Alkalilimnicola ehrlichii]